MLHPFGGTFKQFEAPVENVIKSDVMGRIKSGLVELEHGGLEPTAVPATKFHLYNFLKQHPTASEEDFSKEVDRCRRYSEEEKEYSREGNPLPTIGIEVEVPEKYLSEDKVAVLNELGIPNYQESRTYSNALWEVNPNFTYSPWVQGRILQELAVMGALPMEDFGAGTKKISSEELLSLHINLGLPGELLTNPRVSQAEFYVLSDVMNYAFTSENRLANRKTNTSLIRKSKNTKVSKKSGKMSLADHDSFALRLELRASEFRDYPSYRMLAEVQRLAAILISFMKVENKLPTTETEKKLAEVWPDFSNEARQEFEKHGLFSDVIDKNPAQGIDILKSTDLRQKSRQIFSRYARRVGEIIGK